MPTNGRRASPRRVGVLSAPPQPTHPSLPFEPLSVKIPDAVKITGISRSTLYELIKAQRIETVKLGKTTLVLVPSLRKFLDSLHP